MQSATLEVEQGGWQGQLGRLIVQRDVQDLRGFQVQLKSVVCGVQVAQVHDGRVRARQLVVEAPDRLQHALVRHGDEVQRFQRARRLAERLQLLRGSRQ